MYIVVPYNKELEQRVVNSVLSLEIIFLISQPKHVVGTLKNRLNEKVL